MTITNPTEQFSNVWFSYSEHRYNAHRRDKLFLFEWTRNLEVWDWKDCIVTAMPADGSGIKIIIRNMNKVNSTYMGKEVVIRYMYDFDISEIPEPKLDWYNEPPLRNTPDKKYGQKRQRWVMHLKREKKHDREDQDKKDCWIWEWNVGQKKEETIVYKIYEMLMKLKVQQTDSTKIFQYPISENNNVIPVVYQPALDSWKNFVREVHCHKLGGGQYEVTIIMNGEQLRKHKIFDWIYRIIRKELYHRLRDIETFRILTNDDIPDNFMFSGIYSNGHNIFDDDVHGDKRWFFQNNIPVHDIKLCFTTKKHPVIFINTSNHAMAEHDNNPSLWKWEYVGWDPNASIKLGNKSRKEIEKLYTKTKKLTM